MFGRSFHTAPTTVDQWYRLIHPEDVERIRRAMAATALTGQFSEEFRIMHGDGAVLWIAGHGVTVADRGGRQLRHY